MPCVSVAQNKISEHDVKSALLFSLFRYTDWPDEKKLKHFTIGLYKTNSNVAERVKASAPRITVRGKGFKIIEFDNMGEISGANIQMLYIGGDQSSVRRVATAIRRTSTLLVSDNSSDKRDIMINLVYTSDKNIGFEVNRSNIIFEKLEIDREVLLLGGTELDVAELFREMDYDLSSMRQELLDKERALDDMEKKQRALSTELDEKVQEIGIKELEIRKKELGLGRLSELFDLMEEELISKQQTLKKSEKDLEKSRKKLQESANSLKEREEKVRHLQEEIEVNSETLKRQNEQLGMQQKLIGTQREWIFIEAVSLLLLALLSFMLLSINRARKRGIIQLQQARDRAQQYLDIAGSLIVVMDLKGRIQLINRKGCAIFGYEPKDIVGKNIFDHFIPERHHDKTVQVVEDLKKGKMNENDIFTSVIENNDGQERYIQWAAALIKNKENEQVGIIASGEDYTEKLIIEEQRNRAREEAINANKSKTIFLSNMSHELRTPLNAIMGFAQLLLQDEGFNRKQKKNIETINRSGSHLLDLINDVLDLAKIESGHVDVSEGVINVEKLIEDLVSMFSVRAESKGIEIKFTLALANASYILSDEGKIRQILINLIGNAIKFTDHGGVYIFAGIDEPDSDTPKLILRVKDSGIGIDPSEHDKVFKVFEQADKVPVSAGGTGLGLAISMQYAKLLGGNLELKSALGEGAEFIMALPVAHANEQAIRKQKREMRRVIGIKTKIDKPKMLVADDMESNRDLVKQLFEPFGFQVEEATNGLDALEIVERWQPHVILMDKVMPVMDGIESTKKIRETQIGKNIVIVCVSANVFENEREKVLSAGVDAFLAKPFKNHDLFDLLEKLLDIEVEYEVEQTNVTDASDRSSELESLMQLSIDDLESLKAVSQKDEMLKQISKLADQDAMLAITLWEIAEHMSVSTLHALIEQALESKKS